MSFDSCTFSNNVAQDGGAIGFILTPIPTAIFSVSIQISNSDFSSNQAVYGGGAIYIHDNTQNELDLTLVIDYVTASSNKAF